MPYKDPDKKREAARKAQRKHYKAHREEIKAKQQLYRKTHLERLKLTKERYHAKNPNIWRELGLRRFGWTLETYTAAFVEQKGLCAICGQPGKDGKLHSDHDHSTDTPRGLLCINCNTALGGFKDNPDNLKKAMEYLEKYKTQEISECPAFYTATTS